MHSAVRDRFVPPARRRRSPRATLYHRLEAFDVWREAAGLAAGPRDAQPFWSRLNQRDNSAEVGVGFVGLRNGVQGCNPALERPVATTRIPVTRSSSRPPFGEPTLMTDHIPSGARRPTHPAALLYAREVREGRLDRREFLTRATALGLGAGAAYALLGEARPARAAEATARGGTLRIQQEILAMKEPRLFDWPELSNVCRGWLEYLVRMERDFTIMPVLLESFEANEDATVYTLVLRPDVMWSNGDPLNAEHVVHNLRQWSDSTVEGNSMAVRMGGLVDPETGVMREDAVEAVDERTVRVTLPAPDITFVAGLTDYPAMVVHPDMGPDPVANPIGTGAYRPESYEVGRRAVVVRNPDARWWGEAQGGAALDRIEFIDYGTDPATIFNALESGEIDLTYESQGEFVELQTAIGFVPSEAVTANTICVRFNQKAEVEGRAPYADARVRRALIMAVDPAVLLELGYAGLGRPAEHHHVSPLHPEYAEVEPIPHDPEAALALLEEAGMADYEHELFSLEDGFTKDTCDAVAAELRDAGIPVRRTVVPGASFWGNWTGYPFSATEWAGRPLGVQVLGLAYRTGVPWNETGFSKPEFDALLDEAVSIPGADRRREVMARLERIMLDEGVTIQPYWRSVFNHRVEGLVGAEIHPSFEIDYQRMGFAP